MRANHSFQSILEQKIGQNQAASQSAKQTSTTVDQDPAHLAFLMGVLGKSAYQGPLTKLYPTRPTPPAPPKPAAPPLPPHVFSAAQKTAFDFFVQYSTEASGTGALSASFTQKQLRNAFRRAALRLHPDTNKGTSGPFIELKKHYATLLELFTESI